MFHRRHEALHSSESQASFLRRAALGAALALAVPIFAGLPGGAAASKSGKTGPTPSLVVLISVDQMRADYLPRFEAGFGQDGFRRLLREGRNFPNASYSHAITMTGPGHSVIGTGEYADLSGIVGNHWYSQREGGEVYCASARIPPGGSGACGPTGSGKGEPSGTSLVKSPCRSGGKTLAERVKERYPSAKVVGVSVKDRAAILMSGKRADAAYWLEEREDGSAKLACSSYYPGCRPEVLALAEEEGLTQKPGDPRSMKLFKRHPDWEEWTWSLAAPIEKICPDDVPEAHAEVEGLGKEFPHRVKDVASLLYTPYGNDLVEALAERAVEVHGLGKNPDGSPDILAVGFSSTDYFGHLFGPDSCEAADGMSRLDRTMARFLKFLDSRLGKDRLLVFLTADHGVAPLPEVSLKKGIPAGRLDLGARVDKKGGSIGDLPPIRQRLEYVLARELGVSMDASTPLDQSFILAYMEPNLYLNRDRIGSKSLPRARGRLRDYLLHMEGIAQVFTWDQVLAGDAPDPVIRSFQKEQSGDLFIVMSPYWIPLGPGQGADHGQMYDYDARVPLVAWGRGVAPGASSRPVDVAQIAPTLASVLGLDRSLFSRPTPLPLGSE